MVSFPPTHFRSSLPSHLHFTSCPHRRSNWKGGGRGTQEKVRFERQKKVEGGRDEDTGSHPLHLYPNLDPSPLSTITP